MATSLSKSHHLITLKDLYVNSKRFVNVKKKKKIHINYTFTLKVDTKIRYTLKCEQLNATLLFLNFKPRINFLNKDLLSPDRTHIRTRACNKEKERERVQEDMAVDTRNSFAV